MDLYRSCMTRTKSFDGSLEVRVRACNLSCGDTGKIGARFIILSVKPIKTSTKNEAVAYKT